MGEEQLERVSYPIVGFRAWTINEEPELKSVAMRYSWTAGENVSRCMSRPNEEAEHESPAELCRCGFYARTTPQGVAEEYPYYPVHGYWAYRSSPTSGLMVMGAVLLWGTILRGKRVIRAERGRVLCFTEKVDLWKQRVGSNDPSAIPVERRNWRRAQIAALSESMGVPMIPFESVALYASEFGELALEDEAAG